MTPPHRCVSGTVSPTPADGRFSDESDDVCKGEGEMNYNSDTDCCFANWGDRGIICWSDDQVSLLDRDQPFAPWAAPSAGALAVAEREPIAIVVKRRSRERLETAPVKKALLDRKTQPVAVNRAGGAKSNGRRFGRWWLAGCLTLAVAIGGGMFAPARPAKAPADAARSPASKRIEWIRVGERVVTQDTSPRPLAGEGQGVRATETAVNPKTWKKLVLLAETHWADGTRDDVNIETLQPPEWIGEHDVRIGASIALPLDLVEMGLPTDLHATVIAVEHCPEIDTGPGRVVLTTVNHLNKYVFELSVADAAGHTETIHPTGFHKFYSDSKSDWVSAAELRKGEQLRGVNGALTVLSLAAIPGVHRVHNMMVEDEHVYRLSLFGALVHNANCVPTPRSAAPKKAFLRSAANDPRTPKWMKPWLQRGKVPPGYEVDHPQPLSTGGPDTPGNMRLQGTDLHRLHHRFYRPWE